MGTWCHGGWWPCVSPGPCPLQVGGWWQRAGHSNYQVSWAEEASEKSDPVELVLTDHSYSPPSISIHPEQCVEMGTNITIHCWNKGYGAAFLLHKDGSSPPIKHQDPSGGGAANFTFLAVTPADSGTYRCSYRPRGYPFVSSPLGDSVMLEVTPTAAPSGVEEQSRANLVMALVRGFVAALVFGLGVFFVIDARSLWIRRDDNCVSLSPGCSCLMAPMAVALILGWWLVTTSRAQQLPRPSLSLHPIQRVSLGDNVTLRCHLPRLASRIQLCQDQRLTSCMDKYEMQDVADFYITTKREHAGTYWCQYQVLKPLQTSEKSDPMELVVTDLSFPPPGISLSPGGHVGMGTNITIRCWNKDYGATFLLHKDGCSAAFQRQHPDNGGMATFTLFQVTPTDNGTYRCSYLIKGYFPLLSSPLGDNVTLEVTPTSAHPGAAVESHRNMVVAVAGGCAVAFVFIPLLIIFFLLTTRRCQRLRDKRHGAPPSRPEAVQLQAPCSDSDCLTYVELQAEPPTTRSPAPPADPQPPTIYADVRTGGPH
ncbi:leukocyte immunoglobulin-like receptor subfamily B member 5 isoform X4 [Gallus gallus]|uniref:leukocyte immunoglobulin-like receptor subfamily B member 5 isoform X4 n=1 Tax=Gallus gallus TaxID=9031 RepID=UPI001F016DC2|nr:leukocyte immunoglobulin-like receptor subfamily B member 5 isoform X4 [Gallus gallus]